MIIKRDSRTVHNEFNDKDLGNARNAKKHEEMHEITRKYNSLQEMHKSAGNSKNNKKMLEFT